MLASYIDYFLGDYERKRMRKRPLDVEGRGITRVFVKYGLDDWRYRTVTWQRGPLFIPGAPGSEPRATTGQLSLEQVMDRAHDTHPDRWLRRKADRPNLFGGAR